MSLHDEITEVGPLSEAFNSGIMRETVRRRDEIERTRANSRAIWLERNRGALLFQLVWHLPEESWSKVRCQ